MPLYEPRVAAEAPPEEQAEAVRRAVPHLMDSLKLLKLVVCCLLMMRFYKLGKHWARWSKQRKHLREQQQQQQQGAAPGSKPDGDKGKDRGAAQGGAARSGEAASKNKKA